MNTLGKVTTGVVIIMAVAAIVIGIRSVPDIRRYLKIRSDVS